MRRVGIEPGIFIGTHYEYPFGGPSWRTEWRPKSHEDWRHDLNAIRQTGFNLIRIRIGFDSSLDDTQVLLDFAHELGLKVDYGFASFYAPDWFTQKHPEACLVNPEGETLGSPRDRRWPRTCIEHESYRKLWRELVEGSAQRFKNHPAIIIWDVHNEPLHVCHCQLSQKNFKEYLTRRYGGIEQLNAAWGTQYEDFEACTQRPHVPGAGEQAGVESHFGAWRTFQAEVLSAFLNEGMALIRAHVTDKPVTYNLGVSFERSADWWDTKNCDFPSLSDYWSSDAWTTNKSMRLALLAGIHADKEVPWILETLGGSTPKTWNQPLWTGKHLELETWSFLGKGVKGIVQYRWEPLLAENETLMFSLVDVDSDNTERRTRMTQVMRRVRELEDFLQSAAPIPSQAVIYFPHAHYTQATLKYPASVNLIAILHTASLTLDGWFGLLTHAGYQTRFLCELTKGLPSGQAVVVPFVEFLTDAEWAALERFSDDGGRVMLQLPTEDTAAAERVCTRLGLAMEELEVRKTELDGWTLTSSQGQNLAAAHQRRVTLNDITGSEVIARYHGNQRPALLTLRHGRWLVGTFDIGSSYDLMLRKELRGAIADWLAECNLAPGIKVEGVDEDYRPMVEVNALEQAGRALLVCCNRSPYEWELKITARKHRAITMKVPPFESRQQFAST